MSNQMKAYQDKHSDSLKTMLSQGLELDEALSDLPEPEDGERRDVHVVPAFGTFYFSLNCRDQLVGGRDNPLKDPRVRRALARSIDKQKIVDLVLRTGEAVAETLVPPNSIPGYVSPAGLGFDPERAKAELAEAGWLDRDGDSILEDPDGTPFPTIDFLYSTGEPRYRDMGLAMRDMWSRHLGLETALRGKDTKAYKEDLKGGDFMVARGGWFGDYGDPTTFLDLSLSTDGNNDRGYSSEAFDAMLAEAARERDPERRMAQLSEAERFLLEEAMPILPIYHYATTYMYEPARLRGITRHPRLEQNLWALQPISDR
jgi:oligopeptide transport system substrate-binding protein